jgi:hypothetical protein
MQREVSRREAARQKARALEAEELLARARARAEVRLAIMGR